MVDLPPWLSAGITAWVPFLVTLLVLLVVRRLVLLLLPHGAHKRLPRQVAMVSGAGLVVLGALITLPIDAALKQQLLSLFGLAITAVVALSSTTFAANAMAGLMLRSVKNFSMGDFIEVEGHFGKVSERGLLHTEIQTEGRDLLTLPNLYLITNPVKVVRASGTLVSCDLSLGYDVPRGLVSDALKQAAETSGLTDAFVQVRQLLDHAVVYRVSGFLGDTSGLVSARSNLRAQVLDALHGANVEIVSPSFMNQRRVDGLRMIPHPAPAPATAEFGTTEAGKAEDLMFDKAEQAAKTSDGDARLQKLEKEIAIMEQAAEDAAPGDRTARLEDLQRLRDEAAALRAALGVAPATADVADPEPAAGADAGAAGPEDATR